MSEGKTQVKSRAKDRLYCHAVPIIKGLEEAGEDMEKTKAQIVVLGQMLDNGEISAKEADDSLTRTFGKKAVERAAEVCALHAEEILTDSQVIEDLVLACTPCLEEALTTILAEEESY